MSRRPSLTPSITLNTTLPEDLYTRLSLHLWSELESRVPVGAYREFFSARIREFFDQATLDLAPYASQPPGAFLVRGNPATLALLTQLLTKESA